jgi:hypothetical protein
LRSAHQGAYFEVDAPDSEAVNFNNPLQYEVLRTYPRMFVAARTGAAGAYTSLDSTTWYYEKKAIMVPYREMNDLMANVADLQSYPEHAMCVDDLELSFVPLNSSGWSKVADRLTESDDIRLYTPEHPKMRCEAGAVFNVRFVRL